MPVKSTVEILQNFVAFSEYMNFKAKQLRNVLGRVLRQKTQYKIGPLIKRTAVHDITDSVNVCLTKWSPKTIWF